MAERVLDLERVAQASEAEAAEVARQMARNLRFATTTGANVAVLELDAPLCLPLARIIEAGLEPRPVLVQVREVEVPISWRLQVFWSLVLAIYVQALLQPAAAALVRWWLP